MTSIAPPVLALPNPAPLLSRTGWHAFMVALLLVCAVAPVLNLVVPKGSRSTPCSKRSESVPKV